jgi:hypothetical protein
MTAAEISRNGMNFALPIVRPSGSNNPSKDEKAKSRCECKINASDGQ